MQNVDGVEQKRVFEHINVRYIHGYDSHHNTTAPRLRFRLLLQPGNLLGRVTVCPKQRIRLPRKQARRPLILIPLEVWVDILPANIPLFRDLKQPPEPALTEKCVPIRKSLRAPHERRVEGDHLGLVPVLPDDLLRFPVNLNGAAVHDGLPGAEGAVVENKDVAIG